MKNDVLAILDPEESAYRFDGSGSVLTFSESAVNKVFDNLSSLNFKRDKDIIHKLFHGRDTKQQ